MTESVMLPPDEKSIYINPLTDFGFKRLFGSEPNKDLVIDFLNSILPPHHRIADLSYRNTEHLGRSEEDRKAVFDIYCVSSSGERILVEMQKARQNYFKERSIYYSTFPIQEQASKGHWDFNWSAVYTIGVLDFTFDNSPGAKQVVHPVQLMNTDTNRVFFEKLTYIYLELPKFNKHIDELETQFDKWLFLLRHLEDLRARPAKLQERVFERLFEAASIAKLSKAEADQYEESLKHFRDLRNVVDTARDEGREEGRKVAVRAIVESMRKQGVEISVIASLTGLSEAEIEEI